MKKKKSNVLDYLIKDTINTFTIDKEGKLVQKYGDGDDGILRYNKNLVSLCSLETSGIEKKFREIRYSLSTESSGFFGYELLDLFKKLRRENRATFRDFKIEFEKLVDVIQKTITVKKFTLIYPLNFEFKKEINSKLNNDRFKIISFTEFTSTIFDVDKAIQEEEDKIKQYKLKNELKKWCNEKFSFFIMDVFARNNIFAVKYSEQKIQCILALLIFVQRFTRGESYIMFGHIGKISNLEIGSVMIFEDDKFVDYACPPKKESPALEKVDDTDIRNLSKALEFCTQIKNKKIAEVLFNALIPYYFASIDDELANSYFKYWITIELLFLKSVDISAKEIIKRIKNMPVWKGNKLPESLEYKIETLSDRRNYYAHEFKTDFYQHERNLAKSIAGFLSLPFL